MRNNKGQFVKGNKFTKEMLKKMSTVKLGIPSWNKGKKLSETHRKKLSKAHKGLKPWNKGKTCPQLIGNANGFKKGQIPWNKDLGELTPESKKIRTSIQFRLWRESVFARDNWTCQKYWIRGTKLHPHHIKNFSTNPELRFAIDNGITLSEKAHKEFHKKFGYRNNTQEQLNIFLYGE